MIKIVGFNSNCGTLTSDKTGEVIPWSNRTLRCVTDEGLTSKDFGFAVVEQKFKKSEVCSSLNLDKNSDEKAVDDALRKIINSEIAFTVGRVGKEIKVNGFMVVKP